MNTWIDAAQQLPDDDQCVLIALDDGEVWTGYHDGDDGWRYVSSDPLESRVTHWMQLPEPPNVKAKATPSRTVINPAAAWPFPPAKP